MCDLTPLYPVNNCGWPNAVYVPVLLALAFLLRANKGPTCIQVYSLNSSQPAHVLLLLLLSWSSDTKPLRQ